MRNLLNKEEDWLALTLFEQQLKLEQLEQQVIDMRRTVNFWFTLATAGWVCFICTIVAFLTL